MASCWLATTSIKKKGREVGLERLKRGKGLKKEKSNEEGHFLGPFGLTKERELTVILGKETSAERYVRKKKQKRERKVLRPSYLWKKVVFGVLVVVFPTLVFRMENDANFHPISCNG